AEKALSAVIQEAYVQGVSTRSVDDLVQAMGMSGISKSQVSRLCAELDDKVTTFLNRPLEGDWPYLWLDATYLKVREAGRIVSVAAIIAVGVNSDGRREVLGLGHSEAETFWIEFLRKLARRGLRGVKLVISDAHGGLKAAVTRVLHATWQRCRVHLMRNLPPASNCPMPARSRPLAALAASLSPMGECEGEGPSVCCPFAIGSVMALASGRVRAGEHCLHDGVPSGPVDHQDSAAVLGARAVHRAGRAHAIITRAMGALLVGELPREHQDLLQVVVAFGAYLRSRI